MKIENLPKVLFITGIDTNVGKSYVTGYLAREWAKSGVAVTTQKLVQTGCDGISEDIELHRMIQGIPLSTEDRSGLTCPYVFSYPCSPHLASRIDQREIDFDVIHQSTQQLSEKYNTVLLEGAGGIMVPLKEDVTTLDFVDSCRYPIVLVTSGKLGSINHTLLTLEVCRTRNIEVYAIAYNDYLNDDSTISADTPNFLEYYLSHHFPQTLFWRIPAINVPNKQ